jgi:hypothetical protein
MEGADGMTAVEGGRLAEEVVADGTAEERVYGGWREHGGLWRVGKLAAGFTGREGRWTAAI